MVSLKRDTDANITSAPFSDGRIAVAYDKSKITFDFLIENEEKRVTIDGNGAANDIILSSTMPIGSSYKENDMWFKLEEVIEPEPTTYTIIYKANGGTGNDIIETKTEGIDYTIENNNFTSLDKIFLKWNTAADGSGIDYNIGDVYNNEANLTLYAIWDIAALKFSSDEPFTLSVDTPGWNGTFEYTTDNGVSWVTWNGSQLSGTVNQPVYVRGIGNTKITDDYTNRWTFTGKYCTGNIETLLDYQTVINGQHPIMIENCYNYMFYGCTSLTTAPELPATTLSNGCYFSMFSGCTSLTTVPKLPATTLESYCYFYMFAGCSNIKLSATQTPEYQYAYRIPISDTGITATSALDNMFTSTGGTFTGTPTINTTYYTDHEPV